VCNVLRKKLYKIERGEFGCYDKVEPSKYFGASQKKFPDMTC